MFRQGNRIFVAGVMAAAATVGAGASPAAAHAPRHLWATVNICDTPTYPDDLGVRASMPGDRGARRMYMRFHAQYYDSALKRWLDIRGGVTRWRYVGRARLTWAESGYTFPIQGLRPGEVLVTRGRVDFQWRARRATPSGLRWVPVRRSRAYTRGGHPTREADPPGFSSATCDIRG